jgi:hypothetical protein
MEGVGAILLVWAEAEAIMLAPKEEALGTGIWKVV